MVSTNEILKILLINDDEDDTFILHEVAQYFSHQVLLANLEPNEELFNKIFPENLPDVIVLDLFLGKVNGFDFLKKIRSNRLLKNVPVIIYSSRPNSTIIAKCFALGATLFVEKPHTYKGVERLIKKLVSIDWESYRRKQKGAEFILAIEEN